MKGLHNRVFSILMAVFLVMGMMPAFGAVYAEDDASARGDSQSAASITKNGITIPYETLEDARDAADDGDTIVMLEDVAYDNGNFYVSGRTFTLDLNGHSLSSTGGVTLWVATDGNVTVTDSSSEGGGIIANENGDQAIMNDGTLTITGGTVTAGKLGVYNRQARATISGGMIISENGKSVYNGGGGSFNINGGKFSDTVGNGAEFNRSGGKKLCVVSGETYYELADPVWYNPEKDRYYTALGTAISDAGTAKSTLQLLRSVTQRDTSGDSLTEGQDITIDLNGYKFRDSTESATHSMLYVKGILTIDDSRGGGELSADYSQVFDFRGNGNSTLNVKGGRISSGWLSTLAYVNGSYSGTCNINVTGGTIESGIGIFYLSLGNTAKMSAVNVNISGGTLRIRSPYNNNFRGVVWSGF